MVETPKTVLAHGVFDVIHHGHIAFLEAAKNLGDILVVSVTADRYVNKGPKRPVFTTEQRVDVLRHLAFVDRVVVSESESAVEVIRMIKPDYYVKGSEYKTEDTNGMLQAETDATVAHLGTVMFIDTPADSSSRAINIDLPTIPEAAQKWLDGRSLSWSRVKGWLNKAAGFEFSIAGERIIDTYRYVEPSGQSPKEGYTTYLTTSEEDSWEGGATVIGDHFRAVNPRSGLAYVRGGQVCKTRYVIRKPYLKKVASFAEVSPMHEWDFGKAENRAVADFGHYLFNSQSMRDIYDSSEWIAATIQANSLNFGFNRINKWGWLDYISCDRTELELANPANYAEGARHAAEQMAILHHAGTVAVTMGHEGAVIFRKTGNQATWITVPAFNDQAVDRIGAGDAWFGWTAPLIRAGAPVAVVAFVGACAAAVHISTVGNEAAKANVVHGYMKGILA